MSERSWITKLQQVSRDTGYNTTGDDCAILGDLLVSTDQFIEDIHFKSSWMNWRQIGHKAISQALSDIAAMGASPTAILASLSWPIHKSSAIDELTQGIKDACLFYKTPLVGGDISSSQQQVFIDISVLGESSQPLMKNGAQPGDLVVLTGVTGPASAGLYCLQNNITHPSFTSAFINPKARIDTGKQLNAQNICHALTDTSDSLSKSLHDLSQQSQCGFIIEKEALTSNADLQLFCQKHSLNDLDLILHGGEDYQLLATIDASTSQQTIHDLGLSVIGVTTKEQNILLKANQQLVSIEDKGWDPFSL